MTELFFSFSLFREKVLQRIAINVIRKCIRNPLNGVLQTWPFKLFGQLRNAFVYLLWVFKRVLFGIQFLKISNVHPCTLWRLFLGATAFCVLPVTFVPFPSSASPFIFSMSTVQG